MNRRFNLISIEVDLFSFTERDKSIILNSGIQISKIQELSYERGYYTSCVLTGTIAEFKYLYSKYFESHIGNTIGRRFEFPVPVRRNLNPLENPSNWDNEFSSHSNCCCRCNHNF